MIDARGWRRFRRHRGALVGTFIVLLLIAFALAGPLVAGHDPFTSDFTSAAAMGGAPSGPSAAHWLGTDRIYRDELARLALGARLSLVIALCATAIATVIGAGVGIVAGYYEGSRGLPVPALFVGALVLGAAALTFGHPIVGAAGIVLALAVGLAARRWRPGSWLATTVGVDADSVLMRVVDVLLSFPFLLLVMALGAALDRTHAGTILLTLGLTGWLGTARVVRAKTLQVRGLDFVTASRAMGQSTPRILWKHILPNVSGPLLVIATASVAQMILAESVLSYLGVGIAPPTPTWGHMLYEGQDAYLTAPWTLAAPAVAIVLGVFGFNLLGEGLRDALDPRD